jgi:hypothetical protein
MRRRGFDTRPICVALGQIYLQVHLFSPVSISLLLPHTRLHLHTSPVTENRRNVKTFKESDDLSDSKSVFKGDCIVSKSSYYLCHIRLSIHFPTRISATPTGRISLKFDIGDFYEYVSRKSKFG